MKFKLGVPWRVLFAVTSIVCVMQTPVCAQERKSSAIQGDIKKAKTTVQDLGNRKVTITQLPTPEGEAVLEELRLAHEAEKQTLAAQAKQRALTEIRDQPSIQKSFIISAFIFDDETTYLKCWPTDGTQQPLIAYSNCNWKYFSGHQRFRDGNTQYSFILFPTSAPESQGENQDQAGVLAASPKELPSLRKSGAKYLVVDGDGQEDQLDFLESVHERYDQEKRTLIRTYRQRKKEAEKRKRELRLNPPKPKDVAIRFGRRMIPAPQNLNNSQKEQ